MTSNLTSETVCGIYARALVANEASDVAGLQVALAAEAALGGLRVSVKQIEIAALGCEIANHASPVVGSAAAWAHDLL
jgi:hypothetical protein